MTDVSKAKSRQPEALAELAKTARETTPGDGDRQLTANADNRPMPADNALKHGVAETLLSAGAHGKTADPQKAGIENLPDRTRTGR
jgi:hypothetical protein